MSERRKPTFEREERDIRNLTFNKATQWSKYASLEIQEYSMVSLLVEASCA